jgi:DNA-binding response OmpR family regulator
VRILLIEDEQELCKTVVSFLNNSGFICDCANSFDKAIDIICDNQYTLIVLDLILPDGNGLDILKYIKDNKIKSGIIIISAKNSLEDKIEGLNLGADDYITKPFSLSELLARVKAVIRRQSFGGEKIIEIGNLVIDPDSRIITIDNKCVKFSKKEFDLILYFVANYNKVLSKISLAEHIWGTDTINNSDYFDFLYSQIKNIKKKFKLNNASCRIETIYGIGYKLVEK